LAPDSLWPAAVRAFFMAVHVALRHNHRATLGKAAKIKLQVLYKT